MGNAAGKHDEEAALLGEVRTLEMNHIERKPRPQVKEHTIQFALFRTHWDSYTVKQAAADKMATIRRSAKDAGYREVLMLEYKSTNPKDDLLYHLIKQELCERRHAIVTCGDVIGRVYSYREDQMIADIKAIHAELI